MDTNKVIFSGLIMVGIVLVAVSLLADVIGVGTVPVFGWKQMLGVAVGIGDIVAGAILLNRKPQ